MTAADDDDDDDDDDAGDGTSSLQYYCSCLPMNYIIDQQSILFHRRILTSGSTRLGILVDHRQGFILFLLVKYSISCLIIT